jgi:hypothetical protein
MPAPIAFNTGSQTAGTLRVAGLEYSISSSIGSGSANLRWFSSINPGPYGLIFATSNFTQSYGTYQASTPLFYTSSNTVAGIISASNRLPDRYNQTQFSTTASALEWIASSGKYFMMNYEYPQIVSDKLVYLVDATFLASYPQSNTTTYPIQNTAQVGVGTLQNGVAWAFDTRTFDFDGADDQILVNTSDRFNDITWSGGITVMVLYKIDAVTDLNGQYRAFMGVTGGNRSFNYYLYGASNPATTLQYHFSANYSAGLSNSLTISADRYYLGIFTCDADNAIYWHNGQSAGTQGAGTPAYYTAGGAQYLGRADNFFKGNIAQWAIYNKALKEEEILQNYYQAPIVIDGLELMLDAGNLVSYPASGTTWYDLSANLNNSPLTNGPTFTPNYRGFISFDGVDDFAYNNYEIQAATNSTLQTFCSWVRGSSAGTSFFGSNANSTGKFHLIIDYQSSTTLRFAESYYGGGAPTTDQNNTATVSPNEWNFVAVVKTAQYTYDVYYNGVRVIAGAIKGATVNSNLQLGTWWSGNYKPQQTGCVYTYSRALSAAEVLQNYNAQRNRFGS